MYTYKYSELNKLKSADQAVLVADSALEDEDFTVGVDLGDDVVGYFKISTIAESEDVYTFKEWCKVGEAEFVDEETEGEYDLDEVLMLVESRLQQFHQTAD